MGQVLNYFLNLGFDFFRGLDHLTLVIVFAFCAIADQFLEHFVLHPINRTRPDIDLIKEEVDKCLNLAVLLNTTAHLRQVQFPLVLTIIGGQFGHQLGNVDVVVAPGEVEMLTESIIRLKHIIITIMDKFVFANSEHELCQNVFLCSLCLSSLWVYQKPGQKRRTFHIST